MESCCPGSSINVAIAKQMRRFPAPWTVEQIPGGFKVLDANGQSLAYVYGRETKADADIANGLTLDGKAHSEQHR